MSRPTQVADGRGHTLRVRASHPVPGAFPGASAFDVHNVARLLQPRRCRDSCGLGSFPFARHYSGNRSFFLLLQVLRCFSSLRLRWRGRTSLVRVPPFGYVRINSCWRIPAHFRSLLRPSSPPEAKASSVRPCNFSRYDFVFVSSKIVVP